MSPVVVIPAEPVSPVAGERPRVDDDQSGIPGLAQVGREARGVKRVLTVEAVVVAVLAVFGFRVGARPIHDNSMLTHLRTGVDMARTGSIPRVDPYSFTAKGHPWVVQSWFAEWTYGILERLGGLRLVMVEQGVLTALLAFLVARLARTGSPWRTAAAALIAIGAGVAMWSERPLLFGLVCFALLITVIETDARPWLLVPVAWLWVNTHGSFVLGLAWLAAVIVGEAIDTRRVPVARLRQAAWFVAGLGVAMLNPLGPRLLLFPLAVGDKSTVFRRIVEWRSPDFQSFSGTVSLVFLGVALIVLLRVRPSWRDLLPVVGFLVLGLIAVRNLPLVAVAAAPVLGRALRPSKPGTAHGVGRGFVAAFAVLSALFVLVSYRQQPLKLSGYPEAEITALQHDGLLAAPHHVATQDFVGNYLELRYASRVPVLIDDRYDMFPVSVSDDYLQLLSGGPHALEVLDRNAVDVVVWQAEKPLVGLLRASGAWNVRSDHKGWVVLTRR